MTVRGWLALRCLDAAEWLDPQWRFRCAAGLGLTIEAGRGAVVTTDHSGRPIWYREHEEHLAHAETTGGQS